jgi:hypothetical protein
MGVVVYSYNSSYSGYTNRETEHELKLHFQGGQLAMSGVPHSRGYYHPCFSNP